MLSLIENFEQILSYSPCSVVQYIVHAESLKNNLQSTDMINLRKQINQSKWVLKIKNDQHSDGSWGRFHTQDTKVKQKYQTTEIALRHLHALGLRRGDEVIDKACNYMECLLNNLSLWPDAWEDNKWFATAVPNFITSKLSIFGSDSSLYTVTVSKWEEILKYSFCEGFYNSQKADEISTDLFKVNIHGKYIGLNSINNIILFANIKHNIPLDVQHCYLKWLHQLDYIPYTYTVPNKEPSLISKDSELQDWIYLMVWLSRFYGFNKVFTSEIEWLQNQIKTDGLWDFGRSFSTLKLSDDWRNDTNRRIDQTVFILRMLNNIIEMNGKI